MPKIISADGGTEQSRHHREKIEQIIIKQWKALIDTANLEFERKKYSSSLKLYQKCVVQLQASFQLLLSEIPEEVIAAYTVSHLNIAENYAKLEKYQAASCQYDDLFSNIVNLYEQNLSSDKVKDACRRSLRNIMRDRISFAFTYKQELEITLVDEFLSAEGKESIFNGDATYH